MNVQLGTLRTCRSRPARFARAFLLTEVVTALALTGILLAVMAGLVVVHHRASDHFMSHRRAQLAAESYVEYLRAGLQPPPDGDGVHYEVARMPGDGDWTGLTRLTVTAVVAGRQRRSIAYTLTTYLREDAP